MNKILLYSLIMIGSVLISSVSQIGLKKSAQKTYKSLLKEYLNPLVIISYAMFFASTLLTVFAMKEVPLSLAPILESSGYIFVSVLSFLILKEHLSRKKLIGMAVILAGIMAYTL